MTVEPITLQAAADQLGVHYMTAYRYVRTGRLAATKTNGQWSVLPADLTELHRPSTGGPTRKAAKPEALLARLIAGDSEGSWTLCADAMVSGQTPDLVYRELLGPALETIGDRWADGTVTVAQEHVASSVARQLVGRLGPSFNRRGRKRGTIIVGATAGDAHALPSALFADLLRLRSFEVIDLGGDTPGQSFADCSGEMDDLIGIGIVVTVTEHVGAARQTIAQARSHGVGAPIMAGGRAIQTAADGLAIGADFGAADIDEAIALFESLAAHANP